MAQAGPDFPAIATAFRNMGAGIATLEREAPRLANIPSVQGNQAILDAITNLGQQLGDRITALEDRMTGLEGRMTGLENRQFNTKVCAMNARSYAGNHASHLQPLVNIRTGQAIPHFPNTWNECLTLNDAQLVAIFGALDLPIPPNTPLHTKLEWLRREWLMA